MGTRTCHRGPEKQADHVLGQLHVRHCCKRHSICRMIELSPAQSGGIIGGQNSGRCRGRDVCIKPSWKLGRFPRDRAPDLRASTSPAGLCSNSQPNPQDTVTNFLQPGLSTGLCHHLCQTSPFWFCANFMTQPHSQFLLS